MWEIMRVYGWCMLFNSSTCNRSVYTKYRNSLGRLMGTATLLVGFGDTFHLVPRVLRYF